jgi:hypothetical protein
MDPEYGLKLVKAELPLAVQTVRPKKACRHRRRVVAVGLLIGAALLFLHKRYAFAPESWFEGHPDQLGYDKSNSPTGREAEEMFL